MSPGTKVRSRAQKIANARMQEEILPRLGELPPELAKEWNPLIADFYGDYGMKLKLSDKLTYKLLKDDALMDEVSQIVTDSMTTAMVIEAKDFLTDLLAELKGR